MILLYDSDEISEDAGTSSVGLVNPLSFEFVVLLILSVSVSEKLSAWSFESVTAVSSANSGESTSARGRLCLLLYTNIREEACEDVTESVVMRDRDMKPSEPCADGAAVFTVEPCCTLTATADPRLAGDKFRLCSLSPDVPLKYVKDGCFPTVG